MEVESRRGRNGSPLWDGLGITASSLCLLHCLALPVVVGFLPLLGLQFLTGEGAHGWLAGVTVVTSAMAFVPGFQKHGRRQVLLVMAIGLACVLLAGFGAHSLKIEAWERPITVAGGLILVGAHLLNRSFCHQCRRCQHD